MWHLLAQDHFNWNPKGFHFFFFFFLLPSKALIRQSLFLPLPLSLPLFRVFFPPCPLPFSFPPSFFPLFFFFFLSATWNNFGNIYRLRFLDFASCCGRKDLTRWALVSSQAHQTPQTTKNHSSSANWLTYVVFHSIVAFLLAVNVCEVFNLVASSFTLSKAHKKHTEQY